MQKMAQLWKVFLSFLSVADYTPLYIRWSVHGAKIALAGSGCSKED